MAKTANVLFALELQRRPDCRGLSVLSTSLHPGGVSTEGAMTVFSFCVKPLVWLSAIPADKGAVTSLFAATAEVVRRDAERYKGGFLIPYGEIAPKHPASEDVAQVRGL